MLTLKAYGSTPRNRKLVHMEQISPSRLSHSRASRQEN